MKGNSKIAFTAEAVSFMRDYKNYDRFSKYFVSPEIKRKYKIINWFVPRNYLEKIFKKRLALSKDLDKFVNDYRPEQIIELACGYSTRGLILTQNNPNLIYIETDFPEVIRRKKKIPKKIESAEKITLSKNHYLIPFDAIGGDLYDSLKQFTDRKKKTLIIAETLASYLDTLEHEFLIKNIVKLLSRVSKGAYLSHEGMGMLLGFFGKLLLFYRNRVSKTKSHRHFSDIGEIMKYFLSHGFGKIKIKKTEISSQFIYLAGKN